MPSSCSTARPWRSRISVRFMAQCLAAFRTNDKITILTATSGDTGAAVAHAFYGLEGIEVVILYPKAR